MARPFFVVIVALSTFTQGPLVERLQDKVVIDADGGVLWNGRRISLSMLARMREATRSLSRIPSFTSKPTRWHHTKVSTRCLPSPSAPVSRPWGLSTKRSV